MDKYFKYKYDDLFNPTLKALTRLGGSGAVSEIEEEVIVKRKEDKPKGKSNEKAKRPKKD